jgi:hypothetical protein
MLDHHGHPTPNLWRGVFVATLLGAVVGFFVGYRWAMRRVDVLVGSGPISVDGRVAWNVRACALGCRTEDDVALEKAVRIVRGR